MNKKRITAYNKQKEYDKYIRPLVEQLKNECYDRDIPMFFTAAVTNSETKTEYESAMVTEHVKELVLKEDHIANMVKVLSGFYVTKVVKPPTVTDFMMTGDMAPPDLTAYEQE